MRHHTLFKKVNPDKCLSVQDIYSYSKKDDDFENDSIIYTYSFTIDSVGDPSEVKQKVKYLKENKEIVCRRIWRGIKVSFILNPSSMMLSSLIGATTRLIKLRVKEVNEEFVNRRDPDVLNYSCSFPDHIKTLKEIHHLIRMAKNQL